MFIQNKSAEHASYLSARRKNNNGATPILTKTSFLYLQMRRFVHIVLPWYYFVYNVNIFYRRSI